MPRTDEEILKEARERFREAVEAEREIRAEAEEDLRFLAGEQWDPQAKAAREVTGRPCFTFNKLPNYVRQVGNQARQNKPSIQVLPADSGADPDTAKVQQGMVRAIEYDSNADSAYDTALYYAAACGFGFFRYLTEYESPESFNQAIKVIRVPDPFAIYLDWNAKEPDGSDAMWAFVLDRMSRDAFRARFGTDTVAGSPDFADEGLASEGWVTQESVQVAEYWRVETKPKTLRLAIQPDGTVRPVYMEDLDEAEKETLQWVTDSDGKPRERKTEQRIVKQYIINGAEVLEENDWSDDTIPIVPVYGEEITVKGKRHLISLIRWVRNPQQLLNYYKTIEAETISLAPRPKWVGYVGQFDTKQRDWQRANVANVAYLEADPVTVNGQIAPLPRWEVFQPPVQSLSIGAAQCVQDLKEGTGIYDASLGDRSNETSGVAIARRQMQADISNFHFVDNLNRALRRGGRILVNLIPKIYDTDRQVRIIGEDETERIVRVNVQYEDPETHQLRHYRLDAGRYDVRITTGPSYATARQQFVESLVELVRANPALMQVVGDLLVKHMDWPGADEIAERLRKMLPPNLQDEQKQGDPAQIQAQLQAMAQQHEQLTAALNEATEALRTKRLELESRERIAAMQAEARVLETLAKIGSQEAIELLRAELAEINRRQGLLRAGQPVVEEVEEEESVQ